MCTPQCICEKLGDLGLEEAIKAWKYVCHYTENLQKLQVKLRDLGDCTATITREVSEAIGRDDEIEGSVLHWQTDADSVKVNIEQLIGESTTKASISCIACSCPNIVWRYKFSKRAEDKIANAVELIKNCSNFNHQISHPRSHYMENLQKLKDKLRDLGDCRETITREVSEANDRGDEIEVNVSHWQTDADNLLVYIEQLIRKSANICSTECPCPDITWQYEFSKQAEEKIAAADELIIKYNNFNHQISHPRPRSPELESLSNKNYVKFDSRASIFKDIMDALKDSNVNMIGVFGLGGVGKTTLVKEVGEQMRKDGTFKQVAMAVVSKDLNEKEVQSKLADSLNFEFKVKADDKERRATELWNKFTNGDKYLIILDDIWEKVDLKAIGIPITDGKTGCKVVLTSRNKDLLSSRMEVNRNFSIGELLSAEAWTLFTKKVGNSFESQPELYSLAYKVCTKCKGLPIAVNALGEALKGKEEHAWKTALDKLENYMLTKIEGIDPSVFATLRVSYDMLHSRDAKSCFLLCCLFAEDAEIPIDELMRLCVARNLLEQNPSTLDKARDAVRTVVDTLKSASLLTTGGHETVVKMHDVIRDVGISIAREEEAFLVDHGALRWPQNPTNGPSYKTMSLSFKSIKGLPDGLIYPKLHTLMVANSELSDLEFPDNFFNGMMQLTVLTISGIRMRRLPSSLAKLANLRMLYLNRCKLDDIAILKDLKSNLEVLSLQDSRIEALPPEIGQLIGLRVLDLRDCYRCKVIPRGVISNLTSLEELYFPRNFDKWGATTDELQDTSSEDNASLEELRESLANAQLTTLHIHVPNVKLLPKEDLKFADLKGFRISVGSEFDYSEALISRRCMLKLEGIRLRNEFIPLVDKAEVLIILKPESSVHPLRLFDKLTVLIIKPFKLKYLFSPTTARGLVHLEVLKVTSCEIIEGIVGFEERKDENENTGEVKFGKLKRLELTSLPNLISFFAKNEKMGTTMGSISARAQPLFNELVIFPVLERLIIDGLGNIIKIWDKQSIAVLEEQGSFSQLKNLVVSSCSKLMHVFPSNMHPLLKNLEVLNVEECETMKGIAEFEGEIDEDGLRNEVAASPALEVEHLEMVGVPKITEIRDKQPLLEPKKEVESLCKLMYIHIKKCGQLLYVFPSHMLPQNLQNLFIQDCDELEVIFSKELKEKEAINNDIIVFPRLTTVRLLTLRKLKSFYTETQGFFFSHKVIFPVLKKLSIRKVHKIIEIWDKQSIAILEEQGSFCQLTDLDVSECEKLMHVFPSKMHSSLKNLKVLRVNDCPTMAGIVEFVGEMDEDGLRNEVCFSELSSLELSSLPNLESFFTKLGKAGTTEGNSTIHALPLFNGKVAFPVLERLSLLELGKITRIWDDQPLSEPEKEAKSFSELEDINVVGCDQLEYVFPSYLLPQLKNLQKLDIGFCTKLEVIISNNPKEKEATNNNDTIRFPQLKKVCLHKLPNLKSFICSETQLFFSNKYAFPVLEILDLSYDFEFLRNETSTKEECGTSGKESDYNGEELDEDLETPTKENNKMAGTSPAQARKGKDIQEIPWERLNITREKRRQTRLEQYKNYENIPQSGERSEKDCKVTMKGGMYYEFRRNSRSVKSTIPYPQLRNWVWATSKHDVYFMSHFSVTHWSALTWNKTEVLNVSGHVAPCEKHPGSLLDGFTQTDVSTLAVKDRLLVVGGFQGELICKNLDRPGVCFCTKTTYDDNAITNAVEIYNTQSGAVHFTVANNDCGVRDFDMENFQLSKHFSFPWPVNHTSMSPDGKLRIIVGDNPEGMLVDSGTGKMVASLVGHLDFSFASAWHPDGLTFATGNQDKTCRIWDARNLSKSVAALKGNLGAIRSIRYSSDGRFMAMAEPADFVHVFDAKSGYEKEQEIDFFGEISGMSFSPDTESLFIGVCDDFKVSAVIRLWDRTYGGLLEFGRRRNNSCPDSIF